MTRPDGPATTGPHPGPEPFPDRLRGLGRTLVMGVVNVTPDSFSDGGRWFTPGAAVAHGLELLAHGADLLDVGGESTRPGARRVPVDEELARVLPVVEELTARGAAVSVDTTRAAVARAAVERGAVLVNDVSGGLADEGMARAVAETGVAYVAMHWRGHADVMDDLDDYDDVVADVRAELAARVAHLRAAGVDDRQVVLDPGLGFAKPGASNWPLLARLPELLGDGFPVLVGASRKRFLGHLLARPDGTPAPPLARDGATAAISALAAAAGAWCVRVHEVAGSADAVRVAAAWRGAGAGPAGVVGDASPPGAWAPEQDELPVDEDASMRSST
ncbi:dihydropteroate synthase [Cellulomonas fimi]|uniref:Dihydropteroate synthase n=1 Tax=Cellulomonas fimi (strain ATCC 484 / DSM 20113 / JCM 1341 / CCUG 24087 / LMG 16345 / NBRC 15513 / NCIMB 8980 / NCTC 7547 / NRS-133) TaxID=590998 RepID=F4GY33_CELFA|nr:dihydropteroate synthase [Cellulomonas fimi ATCC 484]VEH27048.1 Dihydropteroate synthase 1 [Cellulomonas fimi]